MLHCRHAYSWYCKSVNSRFFHEKIERRNYLSPEFIRLSFQLPLLDHAVLDCEEDWARAYLVLSALGNGYVWQNGEHDPVKVWNNFIHCDNYFFFK